MGIRSPVSQYRGSKEILVDSRCVVLQIFSFLVSHDLLVARLVCRRWNEWAITDDALWQRAMERELLPPPCHEHQVTISISSVERREEEDDGIALRDEFERWRSTTYERKLKPDWRALFLSNNEATSADIDVDGDGDASQRDIARVVPSARMLFVLRASRRARFVFTERRYFSLFRFFQMEGTSCEELLSGLDVIPRFEGHVFCYNCGMCGHRGEDCAVRPLFDDMFMSTQRSPRERKAIGGWQGGPGAWLPAATHGMTMWSYRVTPSNPNSLAPLYAQDSPLAAASTNDHAVERDVEESSNGVATATENGVDTRNGGATRRNGLVADGTVHTNNGDESDDTKGSSRSAATAAASAAANGVATTNKKKKKKKKKSKRNNANTPSSEAATAVTTTPPASTATQSDNDANTNTKAKAAEEKPTPATAKEREREVALVLTSRRTDALQQAIEIVARLLADIAPPMLGRNHELLAAQDNTDAAAANSRNAAERVPLPHPPYAYTPAGGNYPPSRYPPSPHHYVAFSQHPQHRPPQPQPQPVGLPPHHPHTATPNTPAAASLHSMPPHQAVAFHGHPPPSAYAPSPAAYHPSPALPASSPPSSPTRSNAAPPASPLLPSAPRPRSPSSPAPPAVPTTTTTAASTPNVAVPTSLQPAMPTLVAAPAPAPSSPHRSTPPALPSGALGPYPHGTAYHPVPPPSVRHYYPPNWSHYAPYLTHHHPHHPYAAPNIAAAAALGHPFATSLHSAASTSTTSSALSSSLLSTPPSPASMSQHHQASSSPTFSFSSIALSCSTSTVSGASRPVTFAIHAIPAGLVSPSSSPPAAATPSPLHSMYMARTSSAPLPSSPSSPSSSSSSSVLSPPTSPHNRRLSSPAIAVPATSHPPPPHHPAPPSSPSSTSSTPASPPHRVARPSSPAFGAPSSPTTVAHRVAFPVPVQGAK